MDSKSTARGPATAPSITAKTLAAYSRQIAPVIAGAIDKAVAPLKARIDELESRPSLKYCGVYQAHEGYNEGAAVTSGGSLWVARSYVPAGRKPGECKDWQLAVKRGRDAR
jgi:hypothetical protein